MSMGHFLDLNAQALGLFRLPLALAALEPLPRPAGVLLLRKRAQATCRYAGTRCRSLRLPARRALRPPDLCAGAQLPATCRAIAPQVQPEDLIVIHQEYEFGSTLGFYLQRPSYALPGWPRVCRQPHPHPHRSGTQGVRELRPQLESLVWQLLPGRAARSSKRSGSLAQKWRGSQRIFLWQDLGNQPSPLPALSRPSTSSQNPAAKKSSAIRRTGRDDRAYSRLRAPQ